MIWIEKSMIPLRNPIVFGENRWMPWGIQLREINESLQEFNSFLGKSLNALRNSIVFNDLDREMDDSLKEFNSFRGKSVNALRNSIVFHDMDREIDDSLFGENRWMPYGIQ